MDDIADGRVDIGNERRRRAGWAAESVDDASDAVDFFVQDGDFLGIDLLLSKSAVQHAQVVLDDRQGVVAFMNDFARHFCGVGPWRRGRLARDGCTPGAQCRQSLLTESAQKTFAVLQRRHLPGADAADQHAIVFIRLLQRQCDQSVALEQPHQLAFGEVAGFLRACRKQDLLPLCRS